MTPIASAQSPREQSPLPVRREKVPIVCQLMPIASPRYLRQDPIIDVDVIDASNTSDKE